jgi:histidine triad (HIT) family protein
MMSIFSRIIAGEIPSIKVYEDDLCIAIMDIYPVTKGHLLVISKKEIQWIHEVPAPLLHHCIDVSNILIKAMIQQLWCNYVQLGVSGEEIPHFHIHLIPKMIDPTKPNGSRGVNYEEGEMQTIADTIKWWL